MSSGPPAHVKLGSIEAARGLAATAVVLYHTARHLDKAHRAISPAGIFQFGHAGVDVFFVISGFIILFVHYDDVGRSTRLNHYLGRRFSRVMPTYWVALAITIVLVFSGAHALPGFWTLAWSVTLLPSQHEPILGIAWTLQYEIAFYAMFSLLIVTRAAGTIAFSAWSLIVVATATSGWGHSIVPQSLYGAFNLEFFFGMAAAWWLRNRSIANPLFVLACGFLFFCIAAVLEDAGVIDGYATVARLIYGIPALLMIAGAAEASRSEKIGVPAVLRVLGAASYSIYLFQFVFIGLLWKCFLMIGLTASAPPDALFLLLAGGAVTGGILMSRAVEYPLMRVVRGIRLGRLRAFVGGS